MTVKFLGNIMNLNGNPLKVNDKVDNFKVVDNNLNDVNLTDLSGIKIILSVPSIDTPVCDMEVRKFNAKASLLANISGIYVISRDLPFAQSRWCGAANIDKAKIYSDYKYNDFALKTNTLVKELGLLTRAILILDNDNKVLYSNYLDEITNEPNYDEVLNFINSL